MKDAETTGVGSVKNSKNEGKDQISSENENKY